MNARSKRFMFAVVASVAVVGLANTEQWIEGCKTDWNASSAKDSCTLVSMEVNGTYESVVGVELPYCKVRARCKDAYNPSNPSWQTYTESEYTGTTLEMTQLVNCDGYLKLNNC